MTYKIIPTNWPLFDFHLRIWKFRISTYVHVASAESLTYEYIRLGFYWNGEELFHIRLFDTHRRVEDRLKNLINKGTDYTLDELKEIRTLADAHIIAKEGTGVV